MVYRGDYYEKILCVMVSLQRLLCMFFRTDYIVSDTYEQNTCKLLTNNEHLFYLHNFFFHFPPFL